MVPHGSIRQAVMGMTDRDPDSEQLAKMVDLVRQGMRAGAFGLSSGLYYAPGSYSKTGEVVAMARMAAQFGGRLQQPYPRRSRLLHRRRRRRPGSHHDRGGRRASSASSAT